MLSRKAVIDDVEQVIERLNRRGKNYDYLRKLPVLNRTYQTVQTEIIKFKKMRKEMDKRLGYRRLDSRSNSKIAEKNKRALEQLDQYEKKARTLSKLMDALLMRTPNIPKETVLVDGDKMSYEIIEATKPFAATNFSKHFIAKLKQFSDAFYAKPLRLAAFQDTVIEDDPLPKTLLFHHGQSFSMLCFTTEDKAEKSYHAIVKLLSDCLSQLGACHTLQTMPAPQLHEAASYETVIKIGDNWIRIIDTDTYYTRRYNITMQKTKKASLPLHCIMVLPIDIDSVG